LPVLLLLLLLLPLLLLLLLQAGSSRPHVLRQCKGGGGYLNGP
jgi:hypothetical protein